MNYHQFNNKIVDYYNSRSTSSFCNLSIDRTDLEKIVSVEQIKSFHELKFSWNNLLEETENTPHYFGLIAVQCFAASQMHSDESNAADAYQIRLKEVLGLDDDYNLQNLFRGDDPHIFAQEELWHGAKEFLQKRFGLYLDIPARTRNAGRFVQYPKSQVLLTLEDLKYFTQFFFEEFQAKEDIPFFYFRQRLHASLKNIRQNARIQSLFGDETKNENCVRQVYDYFNKWEGLVYHDQNVFKSPLNKKTECSNKSLRLLLVFEENGPKFLIINEDYDIVSDLVGDNILSSKHVPYPYTGLILFNEMEYENEYVSSRFLYSNTNNYIVINTQLRPAEYRFLEKKSTEKFSIVPGIILYKYRFDELQNPFLFSKYIQAKNPVSLIGGIKLNRRKEYLVGYGPTIDFTSTHIVLQNNNRCDYNAIQATSGIYKVRVDNYKDVEFRLIETKELAVPIESKNIGWNLNSFKMEDKFHVEGCYTVSENYNGIRTWIDLNLQNKKKRYNGTNALLKAINQANI
jgi:hypothetical protein